MTNDWRMTKIFTGLGMYLLESSTCSLVNYHQSSKSSTSNATNLVAWFDKGELCPREWIASIRVRTRSDSRRASLAGFILFVL
jgi:hypothetical protein